MKVDLKEFATSEAYPYMLSELRSMLASRQRLVFYSPEHMETGFARYYNMGTAAGVEMAIMLIERLAEQAEESR